MNDQILIETTWWEQITSLNGRPSKKLFEKVIVPKLNEIDQLKKHNKRLLSVAKTAAKRSCTIEHETCLACDAVEVLRGINKDINDSL